MDGLPVMLCVRGRRCVIVGGGGVARRRAAALHERGAEVVVIGPNVQSTDDWPAAECHARGYTAGDLAGAWLVVIATDDPTVNDAVGREAAERGVLVNRADEPEAGDLTVLAHRQRGPITVGVSTDGISARTAADLAERLIEQVDADLAGFLESARPWRAQAQQSIADANRRQQVLRELVSPTARERWRADGPTGYDVFAAALLEQEQD